MAIVGDDDSLKSHVSSIKDPWVQTRAASIASAVWHEKRHFLDFVLTNYGSWRIRNFLEMYANTPVLLQQSVKNGRLLLPLDSNLDELRREIFEIDEIHPDVLRIAQAISNRKQMLADDRRHVNIDGRRIEFGGEAILEAIAYHVQMGKTHRVFGGEIGAKVQRDHPGHEVIGSKYKWAYEALVRLGLMRIVSNHGDLQIIRDEPFLPLCYAALASRLWGQKQSRGDLVSSYLPAERFGSISHYLAKHHSYYADTSLEDAWEIVNNVCKKLFDRTVVEEIEEDFSLEKAAFDSFAQGHNDHLGRALKDLHRLRGRMIKLLKKDPERVLNQAEWSDKVVNRTYPYVVVAAPAGELGVQPEGFDRLHGYSHPNTDYSDRPEARWWWAAIATDSGAPTFGFQLSLIEGDAWTYIASEYAPIAKLLYAGHKMRVMLGPELLATRIRYQLQTGIQLIVDPLFLTSDHETTIDFWYFITGKDNFHCDLSGELVCKPAGHALDPWQIRLRPELYESLIDNSYDKSNMQFTVWRDWTAWIVSDEMKKCIDRIPINQKNLTDSLAK